MPDTVNGLRHQIHIAGEVRSVVRTMKAVAAASVGQYERAVVALAVYEQTVRRGFIAALGAAAPEPASDDPNANDAPVLAIVFGSGQGLVGRFNEAIAGFAAATLARLGGPVQVIAVGERLPPSLTDAGLPPVACHALPGSAEGITALVTTLQLGLETHRAAGQAAGVRVFHRRPTPGAGALCEPTQHRLLPLVAARGRAAPRAPWPGGCVPDLLGGREAVARGLLRESLFVALFRAAAESLAAEHTSRLAGMQRADRNIDTLLTDLTAASHRLRQATIDEELSDVIAGFEAGERARS